MLDQTTCFVDGRLRGSSRSVESLHAVGIRTGAGWVVGVGGGVRTERGDQRAVAVDVITGFVLGVVVPAQRDGIFLGGAFAVGNGQLGGRSRCARAASTVVGRGLNGRRHLDDRQQAGLALGL